MESSVNKRGLPHADKIYVDVATERPLERLTELQTFGIITFEHVVGKWDLLVIAKRQQSNLRDTRVSTR